jgi:hypothetical protein
MQEKENWLSNVRSPIFMIMSMSLVGSTSFVCHPVGKWGSGARPVRHRHTLT